MCVSGPPQLGLLSCSPTVRHATPVVCSHIAVPHELSLLYSDIRQFSRVSADLLSTMITNVLLSSLLILFSPSLGSLETEITDLLERVTRMEAAIERKDETISELQNDLKQSNNRIAALEESMSAKEKLVSNLDVKLYEVQERLAEKEKTELELREGLKNISSVT